jgi:hypothetical protein
MVRGSRLLWASGLFGSAVAALATLHLWAPVGKFGIPIGGGAAVVRIMAALLLGVAASLLTEGRRGVGRGLLALCAGVAALILIDGLVWICRLAIGTGG